MNPASNLVRIAATHGERPAVRLDDAILTFRDLDDASAPGARLLRERGVDPGDPASGSCCPACPTSPPRASACCAPAAWLSR